MHKHTTSPLSFLFIALAGACCGLCPAQTTTLISRNSAGQIGDGSGCPTTGLPALSADGWYVVYVSFLPDLVPADANGTADVFLRNRHTNSTTLISVSSAGVQGDDISGFDPDDDGGAMGISSTGRYVAFCSLAGTLVAGDANNLADIFVRDTLAGTTTRVSVSSAGLEANGKSSHCHISPSADGRFVVFDSDASNLVAGDTNGRRDVFLRDRVSNTTQRVSISSAGAQADQDCMFPAVSADGRYVVFTSGATTLAPGGNPGRSVFLRDRTLGQTFLIGVSNDTSAPDGGNHNPETAAVSDDGRYVAYGSNSPALTMAGQNPNRYAFVTDRQTGVTTEVSVSSSGTPASGGCDNGVTISPDGRFVGFMCQADNLTPQGNPCRDWQAFVRDRALSTTRLVSVSSGGAVGNQGSGDHCFVSSDGNIAVYDSNASNLVAGDANLRGDVMVRDSTAGTTTLASISSSGFQGTPDGGCLSSVVAGMTPDARYVMLLSTASNLAACGRTDQHAQVYLRDRDFGVTEFISVNQNGNAEGDASDAAAVSDDGRYVAFASRSAQLVNNDGNNAKDIFLRDRLTHTTTLLSVDSAGQQHNGSASSTGTDSPDISADGRYAVFHSDAPNLAGLVGPGAGENVFVRDTASHTTTLLTGLPGMPTGGYLPRISADGQTVSFTAGDDSSSNVYLVPRAGGPVSLVSPALGGGPANGPSRNASISGTGRFIAFLSSAANLVVNDTNNFPDVFVRDTLLNTTTRVSVDSSGAAATGPSIGYPAISRDGRYVVFCSDAGNLIPGDTNTTTDTFVHDISTHRTTRVSVGALGQQGLFTGGTPYAAGAISADGRYVAFTSYAPNLVADDTNNASDAFLRDLGPQCPADLGSQGGIAGPDGLLDNNDFIVFIDYFFNLDARADVGSQGGVSTADGLFDNNDFVVFIERFFTGC